MYLTDSTGVSGMQSPSRTHSLTRSEVVDVVVDVVVVVVVVVSGVDPVMQPDTSVKTRSTAAKRM